MRIMNEPSEKVLDYIDRSIVSAYIKKSVYNIHVNKEYGGIIYNTLTNAFVKLNENENRWYLE